MIGEPIAVLVDLCPNRPSSYHRRLPLTTGLVATVDDLVAR